MASSNRSQTFGPTTRSTRAGMPEQFVTPGKKHRRDRGSGGVFKRSNGTWVGTVELPPGPDGRRRQKQVTSRTKSECIRKLNALKDDIARGLLPTTGRDTVETWLGYWLEHIARNRVRPTTIHTYRLTIANNIVPHIGDRRLTPLTKTDVRSMLTAIHAAGKSSSTASSAFNLLAQALDAAMKGHPPRVVRNVCKNVDPPRVVNKPRSALTLDQARRLLLMSIQVEDPAAARWAVYLLTGIRQGECLGLTWDRVDLERGYIDVSWQLQKVRLSEPEGPELVRLTGQWAFVPPKSNRSRRIIPLIPPLVEILRAWRDIAPPNQWGLLWVRDNGQPMTGAQDREEWYAALHRAGIPRVVVHSARHTTVTLLQELEVPEDERMQLVGQSSVAVHREYAHTKLDTLRAQMGKLAELLPPQ